MLKLLGSYKNGNYKVIILEDGTKIRVNNLDSLIPEKPESMDIKITNMCDMGCKFCHEDSKPDGLHGNIMNLEFINTLLPYTELAIGGGNPLTHPDLIPFLELCKSKKLIPNMTINQYHFMKNIDLIEKLVKENLIYGLGVSLTAVNSKFLDAIKKFPNAVIHIINGVQSFNDIEKLYDKNLKILILGYKEFRRGKDFYSKVIEKQKTTMYDKLEELMKHFQVVSFDNLALKQLDPKRLLTQEEWDSQYMGDDGQFTMYIDCVKKEFARSSTSTVRYELKNDIKEMFEIIQKETRELKGN